MNDLDELAAKLDTKWPAIDRARKAAEETRDKVGGILAEHDLIPVDTSFVVFGSLARNELTVNSDIDWSLLVDGQARPEHLKVAQNIAGRLRTARLANDPNPTGTFGKLAFSHSIIHNIGGEQDTNQNITSRTLLLLESRAIGDPAAYSRTVDCVLNRYLDDDISFVSGKGATYKVPRFLLNDIVRYWRTMCVDYASKHRERQGKGWALRNAKLRLSRKLIFVSGMLACLSCHLDNPDRVSELLFSDQQSLEPLLAHLRHQVSATPLEILARNLSRHGSPKTAVDIFGAYNDFLDLLNDGDARAALESLASKDARTDKTFERVREISNRFQEGLIRFFYEENEQLASLTKRYGLF